jgi:hypothetical protein
MNNSLSTEALKHVVRIIRDSKEKRRRTILLFRQSKLKKFKVFGRRGNVRRRREDILLKIAAMNDDFFRRFFRMDRETFEELLSLVEDKLKKDEGKAKNSSGMSVQPCVKLCLAIRYLSGGSYLDLAFSFDVAYKSVMTYVWEVFEVIDEALNNINFPMDDEEKLKDLEAGFSKLSKGCFKGTVAAGDGVVFRMHRPAKEAVDGDVASFFTCKGYYAYGMQAFVDSKCRFLSISMKMASSTHDHTAYIASNVSVAIKGGKLPTWAHIVLDEAYPNTEQELSPYRGRNLDLWSDSFNYHLSLHRQCVERAFGILVQRWGVFWRALRVAYRRIPLVIRVACKLHNFLTDRNGIEEKIEIARGDVQYGDMASALFTDGTGGGRGRRSDLEDCERRTSMTERLRGLGITRPAHSQFSRVARI